MAENREKLVPEIRFKGFTDAWVQRKLGELIDISSASRVHKEEWTEEGVPFFRSSDVTAAFNKTQNAKAFISFDLYEKLATKSGKVSKSDVLVTGGGSIAIPYLVPNDEPLYFKDADLIWLKTNKHLNGLYLFYFYSSPKLRKYVSSISHIGTISHYTIEQAKATPISNPCMKEQAAIGKFFNSLDNAITLYKRKLEGLQGLKKAFLQQMFPHTRAFVPKLRFSDFADIWKQRKLGDLIKNRIIIEQSDGNHGELYPRIDEFQERGVPYISASNISSDGNDIDFSSVKYLSQERGIMFRKGVAKDGDILLAHNATVGPSLKLKMSFNYAILSTSLTLFRLDDTMMNAGFFLALLRSRGFQFQLERFMKQTTRNQVPILTQRLIDISYPIDIEEQRQIGVFFNSFDTIITLYKRKIECLQELKKGYMQRMFPRTGV